MPEITMQIKGLTETMKMLKDVEAFLQSPDPMQHVVDDVKQTVLDKTGRGLDYMGRRFKPYSKAYAKKKHKTRVDLRDTGTMLNSVHATVLTPSHGQVKVTAHELIAQYHNLGGAKEGRPPKREFLNLAKTAVLNLAKKYFDDPIQKILGRR